MYISARYKLLRLKLLLGQLYTDDTNDNDDNGDDTNDDDNDTQWTNHDCIGSLACMPNEPKTVAFCKFLCNEMQVHRFFSSDIFRNK